MRSFDDVDRLRFDSTGLFGDRTFMWVEAQPHENVTFRPGEVAQPGQFLSQREDPALTQIELREDEEGQVGLSLAAPPNGDGPPAGSLTFPRAEETVGSLRPVQVWGWSGHGVDQGDAAAEWGQAHIGRPVRLVSISATKPRHVENDQTRGRVGFADGYPLLITSEASIAEVNRWLTAAGKPEVPTNRYRPTIILGGLEPFGEDYISTLRSRQPDGSELTLSRVKACARCPIPDTDQGTGERQRSVRSALGKNGRVGRHVDHERYGSDKNLFFGQNFSVEAFNTEGNRCPTELRLGQTMTALPAEANWVTA